MLMMLFSIACFGQRIGYVDVHRDSLYTILLNVSELKIENSFLRKNTENQKLIIVAQGIIIETQDIKANALTQQIKKEAKTSRKKWWDGFGKGTLTGAVIILGILVFK